MCPKCKVKFSISEFHKNITKKDKHDHICKMCVNKSSRERYRYKLSLAVTDEVRLYREDLELYGKKNCSVCKLELPLSEFSKNRKAKSLYSSACKRCYKAYNTKLYYSDKFNYRWLWCKLSLESHTSKKKYIVKITKGELYEIALKTAYCVYCGVKLKWIAGPFSSNSATLDRINNTNIIALSNTQIICRKCNTTKGKMPHVTFLKYCTSLIFSLHRVNSISYVNMYTTLEVQEKISASLRTHKSSGHTILVSIDQAYEKYMDTHICIYCGEDLHLKSEDNRNNFSLDRKDNSTILTIDNVQFICLKCNAAKQERTHQEFMDYKQLISYRFDIEFEEANEL